MKTFIITALVIVSLFTLTACSGEASIPMTDKEKAESHGMSLQEYKEMKDASARMGMDIDDHMKMMGGE
ncbi:MAG: hypothetical protein Q8O95_02635 [bacterium]|nr:hypothetical protein [bacterium]